MAPHQGPLTVCSKLNFTIYVERACAPIWYDMTALLLPGRVRFGHAGNAQRDYEVFTVNAFVRIAQGMTFAFQQYVVTGRYLEM